MNSASKIPTGVPGLDNVLMGGLIPANFYLIQGDPGSGKTTMALQYASGRAKAGEKVLYVSLTETSQDLENAAASFLPFLAQREEGRGEEPQGTGGNSFDVQCSRVHGEGRGEGASPYNSWALPSIFRIPLVKCRSF